MGAIDLQDVLLRQEHPIHRSEKGTEARCNGDSGWLGEEDLRGLHDPVP